MVFVTGKTAERKKKGHICLVHGCSKKCRQRYQICSMHDEQRRKERDPEEYRYRRLKGNAKRRGKEFTLTLDEFRKFCKETGYLEKTGRGADSYTIDRIDNAKGYSYNNIRVITKSENSFKENNRRKEYPIDTSDIVPASVIDTGEEVPF